MSWGASRSYAVQDTGGPVRRERSRNSAGDEVPQESVQAVERPGTLHDQILASLGKETQYFYPGFGIDRWEPLVAPGR
jgi:hypothetical protein